MISSTGTAIGYNTDGVQTRFAYPFALIAGDHLEITLADIPVSSGFTVVQETLYSRGATIVFDTAPATGMVLAISRATPITQLEDFVGGEALDGNAFERALDKLTMIVQDRNYECGDCIPVDDSTFVPIFLTAVANGTDQIDLTWTNVTDETGYEIQRSPNGVDTWTTVALKAVDVVVHSDTGLDDGTTYYYRSRAFSDTKQSDWSNIVNATTGVAAPSGLTATQTGTTTMSLAWTDNSVAETGFTIQRSLDGSTGWVEVLTPAADATTANDSGLTEGTQYFYRIAAVGASTSAWSNTANDFTLPAAPSSLAAVANGSDQIDLTWVDNSAAETSFSIERSLDGSTGWTEVLTPAANATSASDTGLSSSTQYFYRARAVRSGDNSAYSNTANATTAAGLPNTGDILWWGDGSSANFTTGDWSDMSAAGNDHTYNAGNLPVELPDWNSSGHSALDFNNCRVDCTTISSNAWSFAKTGSGDANGGAGTFAICGEWHTLDSGIWAFNYDGSGSYVSFRVDGSGNIILSRYFSTGSVTNTTLKTGYSVDTPFVLVATLLEDATLATTVRFRYNADAVAQVTNTPSVIGTNMGIVKSTAAGRHSATPTVDNVYIAENVLWDIQSTDSELDEIASYLGTKYGIAV